MSTGIDAAAGVRRFSLLQSGVLQVTVVALAVILIAMCLFGPFFAPYDPGQLATGPRFSPPSLSHLMGTDNLGRDVLSRFLSGARISIGIGLIAAVISTVLGLVV